MKKSVVLLSGGLDSSVNFLKALRETSVQMALTFDYGQRAARQEIKQASLQCQKYGIIHKVINLPWLMEITKTSLVNRSVDVPLDMEIDNLTQTKATAKNVWVPNRNGVFLNIAAAFAESVGASVIVPGFNKEEATTFPDNSVEFMLATDKALGFSTANQVEVVCYTASMDKSEIARLGRELGADFNLMWPCYFGEDKRCGRCESCLRFDRAISNL